jgi:hypothetical protein
MESSTWACAATDTDGGVQCKRVKEPERYCFLPEMNPANYAQFPGMVNLLENEEIPDFNAKRQKKILRSLKVRDAFNASVVTMDFHCKRFVFRNL